MVVAVRSRSDEALLGEAVEADRLADLVLVPDDRRVWDVPNHALGGEIVPACHHEGGRNAQGIGGPQMVTLRRADLDQRRDDDDIGAELVHLAEALLRDRHPPLQGPQESIGQAPQWRQPEEPECSR